MAITNHIWLSSCRLVLVAMTFMSTARQGNAAAQCLDWSRAFDRPGNGLNGPVYTLVNFDDGTGNAVYAGGTFTQAGNVDARGVAKWDGTSWSPLGAGLGTVTALAVYDDGTGPALYAAGQFTRAGGAAGDRVAKWDGTAWVDVGGGLTNNAWCMTVFDDGTGSQLYVGGDFWGAGGQLTDRFASWNGSEWRTWYGGPGARTGVAMAYDEARGETIVFAGRDSGGYRADTLAYDGAGWTEVAPYGAGPAARFNAEMAYDSLRQRCILFGGQREGWGGGVDFVTWQWDGSAWTQVAAVPAGITNRYDFKMAYDRARDRVVMFGGQDVGFSSIQFNETWEFDGTTWSRVTPAVSPSVRRTFGMAYDQARQCVVLFGGYNSTVGALGDTWEYDGTTWNLRATTGPAPRYGQAMTYDPAGARVLMYDGTVDTGTATETWSWDGSVWTQLDAGDPDWPARRGPMVFDTTRGLPVQLTDKGTIWEFAGGSWISRKLGGFSDTVYALTVHDDGTGPALYAGGNYLQVAGNPGCVVRWDGYEWSAVGPFFTSHNPINVRSLLSSDVAGSAGLYAGGSFGWDGQNGNLARWDGTAWSLVGGVGPNGTVFSMAEFDDGSGPALHAAGNFGSFGLQAAPGTAKFNGSYWHGLGFTRVSGRSNAAMAFDDSRAEAILFGGTSDLGAPGSALGDTWSWDGRTWALRTATGPSARFGHAMAYDAARERVLLVGGGVAPTTADSQTWSWDGSSWSSISTAFGAGGRFDHAVCYDSDRDRLVLFGGRGSSGVLNDTWEFDGTSWSQVATGGPPARAGHAMAYDQARQRTVLFGGQGSGGDYLIDTWEWDGSSWAPVTPGFGSGGRAGHTMVYDTARQKVLVCGGRGTAVQGFADVQQWDGTAWSELYSAWISPTARPRATGRRSRCRSVTRVATTSPTAGPATASASWTSRGASRGRRQPILSS